jgi:pimeloyl-ACP methyl ester carboxylesterase
MQDAEYEQAQSTLLAKHAPEVKARRIRWSHGETQVLEAGDGPPLLMIHGGLDNAAVWVPILPALARNHRVLAVDLPGHGLSSPFDYRSADLRSIACQFVREVIEELHPESFDIVGCSVGGWFAIQYALDASAELSHLALIGAPAGLRRGIPIQLRILGIPVVGKPLGQFLMSKPSREENRKFAEQIAVCHPERLLDEGLDVDVASQRRNLDRHLSLTSALLSAGGIRRELMLERELRELDVPTLLLCGDGDLFAPPSDADVWAVLDKNPHIRVARLFDTGHLAWIDSHDQVVEELERFLAEPTGESLQ